MHERDCKITARIPESNYHKVQDNFYHGQQTRYFRCVFKSIIKLIDEGRFNEVTDYMYKGKDLTLPAVEDE